MDKQRVLDFFGKGQTVAKRVATANAIGCTPQAVSEWPDPLTKRIQDRVISAAFRLGKKLPSDFLDARKNAA